MVVFVAMEASQGGSGEVAVITPTVTNTTDLTQVLSGLQNSGELTSVLQQQPHLVEGTVHKHQMLNILSSAAASFVLSLVPSRLFNACLTLKSWEEPGFIRGYNFLGCSLEGIHL